MNVIYTFYHNGSQYQLCGSTADIGSVDIMKFEEIKHWICDDDVCNKKPGIHIPDDITIKVTPITLESAVTITLNSKN